MKYVPLFELIRRSVRLLKQRFVDDGCFEGRQPVPIQVDERWHQQQYPDVGEGVRRGILPSGHAHFDEGGYREGRLALAM